MSDVAVLCITKLYIDKAICGSFYYNYLQFHVATGSLIQRLDVLRNGCLNVALHSVKVQSNSQQAITTRSSIRVNPPA